MKRKISSLMGLFFLSFLFLLSCHSGRESMAPMAMEGKMMQDATVPAAQMPRKLIREADIRFESSDVNSTLEHTRILVARNGGYISEENQSGYENRTGYDLVIRVPENRFDSLVSAILSFGEIRKLENKNIRLQDVTEEFVDLEARMRVKKETEAKYLDLLKKAKNLEETLAVEKQLSDLRVEIESMEGRLKYLSSQVNYSTIRLGFYQEQSYSGRFLHQLIIAFRDGWQIFLRLLTGLAYLWVILLIGISLWLFLRWRRNTKRKNI